MIELLLPFFFGKTQTRTSAVKVDKHQKQKILNNAFSVHMECSEWMLAAHSQGPEYFPRESDSQRNSFQEVPCAHGAADLYSSYNWFSSQNCSRKWYTPSILSPTQLFLLQSHLSPTVFLRYNLNLHSLMPIKHSAISAREK